MFGFIKNKIAGWVKSAKEKLKEKSEAAPEEKAKPEAEKPAKKKEKIQKEMPEKPIQEIEQVPEEIEVEAPEISKEKIEETEPQEQVPEKKGFFQRLKDRFTAKFSEKDFEELFSELEISLLESNVAVEAIDAIKKDLKVELLNKPIKANETESELKQALKDAVQDILIEPFDLIEKIKQKKEKPFVIVMFGINGSGKTTSIAKLAHFLQKSKLSVCLAAADTFRAASIEQLQIHADKLGVKMIKHDYGSDPAAVAFDAVKYAKQHNIDAVLIDTAGRMHTKENLLKEMEKICRVSAPDLKIFIGESTTGNDATEQARTFNKEVGIDGIILSKADVDEKGGAAISVGYATKKPILFLGTGQKYEDLKPFSKQDFIRQIIG